jgi:lincosamide nucleotidyltransferase A/C/D/E
MFEAQDVLRILHLLQSHAIPVWIGGGWGIDALLGRHTRPHKDLDLLFCLEDAARFLAVLAGEGYTLAYTWPENIPVPDGAGGQIATAFVLREPSGHEIDAHALRCDTHALRCDAHALRCDADWRAFPAWDMPADFFFQPADLAGQGVIAGEAVACLSPGMQVRAHQGYDLPDTHAQDLRLLREKFGE